MYINILKQKKNNIIEEMIQISQSEIIVNECIPMRKNNNNLNLPRPLLM